MVSFALQASRAVCVALFLQPRALMAQSLSGSGSASAAAGTNAGSLTQVVSLISGTAVGPATATYTSLLSVPSYTFASSLAPSATAALAQYIAPYQYNLTVLDNSTRSALCAQQTQYCTTAGCETNGANVTTNFCNPSTMGWNCKCSTGDSRLQYYESPVQFTDCQLRGGACLVACQNPTQSAITNIGQCQSACTILISQTCGQPDQIMVDYQVDNPSDTPTYAGNTLAGGAVTRSAATVIAVTTLLSAAMGAMLIFIHVTT